MLDPNEPGLSTAVRNFRLAVREYVRWGRFIPCLIGGSATVIDQNQGVQ